MIFDDDAQEFYEERAGILEHMAGWPREKAEALARAEAEAYQMAKRNTELKGGASAPSALSAGLGAGG